MILKRQDILGDQDNFINEEALASLAPEPAKPDASKAPAAPGAAPLRPPYRPDLNRANYAADQKPEAPAPIMQPPIAQPQVANAPQPVATMAAPAQAFTPVMTQRYEQPKHATEGPAMQPASSDSRRLVVGADISLNGEISACNILDVEGTVQAVLKDCNRMEVHESGTFKGDAELQDAVISGLYEGNLVVRGKLWIKPSGKVRGSVRYNQLQVDVGGEISGEIASVNSQAHAAQPKAAKNRSSGGASYGAPMAAAGGN